MSRESAFIARLAAISRDPAARGLSDDCAVLPMGDRDLVLTHDMLVEGVHFLPGDPAGDVAWKLVAVNLSDLAAKGAVPTGVLLGYALGPDAAWDEAFAAGLDEALAAHEVPLLGGDTVRSPGPRSFGLTAIGTVSPGMAPARSGARAGDELWVTGRIGAGGLGLAVATGALAFDAELIAAYRRPVPRLAAGQALAPGIHAMADVSDGLLIDAARMAKASGLAVTIDLATVPCHPAVTDRIAAVTAGDDYELLFAAPPGYWPPLGLDVATTRIGAFDAGAGLTLTEDGRAVPLPAALGYEH